MKSADDYQGKGSVPGFGGALGFPPSQPGMPFGQPNFGALGFQPKIGGIPPVVKPNPYVIAETKTRGDEGSMEVTFKYPRSKIFVGGLDFKLTVEELK